MATIDWQSGNVFEMYAPLTLMPGDLFLAGMDRRVVKCKDWQFRFCTMVLSNIKNRKEGHGYLALYEVQDRMARGTDYQDRLTR